jgi:hypothetical protein
MGGSRRCPFPASLEDVEGGHRRTNRAGQSLVPQYRPARAKPPGQVSDRQPAEGRPAGLAGRKTRAAGQTPPRTPRRDPGPSLWVWQGKAGLKWGRHQAELGPRRLPRTLLAGASGAGPEEALGAAPPRPGRCPGGEPADCQRVSRECTGRAGQSKRP